jgi:ArsR family transcriptional regulator, lead/cadmium/zinc/bismuth-responsive transcriptional repressor
MNVSPPSPRAKKARASGSARRHTHEPRGRRAIDDATLARAAGIFRAAGDPARLWLLDRLCDGEQCVGELAEEAGTDMATTSQRLKVLRAEGMLVRRREGKHVYYSLADAHVAALIRSTIEHAQEPWEPALPERKRT